MRIPNQAWDPAHTVLDWSGCRNVRDVGSMPLDSGGFVRSRVLIRSDNLETLDADGVDAVRRLKPRLIVDLRTEGFDVPSGPHPFESWPIYRRLSFIDMERDAERVPESELTRADTYRGGIDRNGRTIAAAVRAIAEAGESGDGPMVVHCHAGIDRTGVLVGLLLDLVGAERSAIAADYAYSAATRGQSTGAGSASPILPETMLETLQHVDTRHGGVRRYLLDHGISTRVVDAIRRMLVESPRSDGACSYPV